MVRMSLVCQTDSHNVPRPTVSVSPRLRLGHFIVEMKDVCLHREFALESGWAHFQLVTLFSELLPHVDGDFGTSRHDDGFRRVVFC